MPTTTEILFILFLALAAILVVISMMPNKGITPYLQIGVLIIIILLAANVLVK